MNRRAGVNRQMWLSICRYAVCYISRHSAGKPWSTSRANTLCMRAASPQRSEYTMCRAPRQIFRKSVHEAEFRFKAALCACNLNCLTETWSRWSQTLSVFCLLSQTQSTSRKKQLHWLLHIYMHCRSAVLVVYGSGCQHFVLMAPFVQTSYKVDSWT